jgi:hypothetical protein
MGKSPIGFGHAVRVFTLFDGGAAVLGGVHELVGEPVRHGFLGAAAGRVDRPARTSTGTW